MVEDKEKKLTADGVINAILDQMEKDGQEFPDYIRAPGSYFAYLHKDDYKQLQPHEDEIIEQARLKLDEKIKLLEDETARKKSGQGLGKKLGDGLSMLIGLHSSQDRRHKPYRKPAGGWSISLSLSDRKTMLPGEVDVETKPHASPRAKPDTGGLTQVKRGAPDTELKASLKKLLAEVPVGNAPKPTAEPIAKPVAKQPATDRVYATIQFDDGTGQRVHEMRKPVIVIRCGDQTGDADLRVKTPSELFSGELRLRHEEKDGEFYFQSSGQSGIKIGGQPLPAAADSSSVWQAEVKLPPRARINLAGVVVLDFTAC